MVDFNDYDGSGTDKEGLKELLGDKQELVFNPSHFEKFGTYNMPYGTTMCICHKDELTHIFGVSQPREGLVWWVGSDCICRFGHPKGSDQEYVKIDLYEELGVERLEKALVVRPPRRKGFYSALLGGDMGAEQLSAAAGALEEEADVEQHASGKDDLESGDEDDDVDDDEEYGSDDHDDDGEYEDGSDDEYEDYGATTTMTTTKNTRTV